MFTQILGIYGCYLVHAVFQREASISIRKQMKVQMKQHHKTYKSNCKFQLYFYNNFSGAALIALCHNCILSKAWQDGKCFLQKQKPRGFVWL